MPSDFTIPVSATPTCKVDNITYTCLVLTANKISINFPSMGSFFMSIDVNGIRNPIYETVVANITLEYVLSSHKVQLGGLATADYRRGLDAELHTAEFRAGLAGVRHDDDVHKLDADGALPCLHQHYRW